LRELIECGEIPDGRVDVRSICDVSASDVAGFTRCHFFAGIGGWSLALRLAGWPESESFWTNYRLVRARTERRKRRCLAGLTAELLLSETFMRTIDLPSPETIRKFTKAIAPPAGSYSKWMLRNMEAGLTARGTPKKIKPRPEKV